MMLHNPLLLLATVTLCCCVTMLHAFQWQGCHCLRTTPRRVPIRTIEKLEVFPVSGKCRRLEIIITLKNGNTLCADPQQKWINNLLRILDRENATANTASVSTPASTTA